MFSYLRVVFRLRGEENAVIGLGFLPGDRKTTRKSENSPVSKTDDCVISGQVIPAPGLFARFAPVTQRVEDVLGVGSGFRGGSDFVAVEVEVEVGVLELSQGVDQAF